MVLKDYFLLKLCNCNCLLLFGRSREIRLGSFIRKVHSFCVVVSVFLACPVLTTRAEGHREWTLL